MHRVALMLTIALLFAQPIQGSGHSLETGETNIHTWGASEPTRGLDGPCPDDIFFVTATLKLTNPSPGDHVSMTTDHVTTPPATVANAIRPVASMDVQLGGCDRSFTVFVTGLAAVDPVEYTLSFS